MSEIGKMSMKFISPITTGTYNPASENGSKSNTEAGGKSFEKMLRSHLDKTENKLNFSKHAQKRIEQRSIELDEQTMDKLSGALDKASAKGLKDTLVLMGDKAFIVNAKSRTIVTAIASEELKGNVFTNIEGTVLV